MKKTFFYLMLPVIISIVFSCSNPGNTDTTSNTTRVYSELEKASWLIGEWQNIFPEGSAFESWEKKNDSALVGKSYFIVGNDTVNSETIQLEQIGNDLFYIPVVKGQNEGLPVKFTLTKSSGKQLVFENPQHDFPQIISYSQITNDSLLAEISGTIDGKQNSRQFPMTRVK